MSSDDIGDTAFQELSPILANAIDSIHVAMELYSDEDSPRQRKQAILAAYHAIELLLKERLSRINPILIYRNIDKNITEDSVTVGSAEAFVRLNNLGVGLGDFEKTAIQNIQKRRNRIEHHRYDHLEEDREVLAEALKFAIYFMEFSLVTLPRTVIETDLFDKIDKMIFQYGEKSGVAEFRLESWLKEKWPEWNQFDETTPDEFEGTLDCPKCGQCFLVRQELDAPFCYWCNCEVDAVVCDGCGRSTMRDEPCCQYLELVETGGD